MAASQLSTNDLNVLEKIRDPESDPLRRPVIDHSMPLDPHVSHTQSLMDLAQQERTIILSLNEVEIKANHGQLEAEDSQRAFRDAIVGFGELISQFPNYASARNNRAQALRRLYGDNMLVKAPPLGQHSALLQDPGNVDRRQAALTCLRDLEACIQLLTPADVKTALSAQAAKTLASAHTQRAAIYHNTAKAALQGESALDMDCDLCESAWSRLDFETAASHEFARGGWYGNEIAKVLAVATNPAAKLCGEIVQAARRREYGDLD